MEPLDTHEPTQKANTMVERLEGETLKGFGGGAHDRYAYFGYESLRPELRQ